MSAVFADTSYYIALISPRDSQHAVAQRVTAQFSGQIVTTGWVVFEQANNCARRQNRELFLEMHDALRQDPRVRIVPVGQEALERGLDLYRQRGDKDWSLTDCISFLVMNERGIREALTADRHFQQAGFRVPMLEAIGE
jgi:predicted nucleic acid-binding protein